MTVRVRHLLMIPAVVLVLLGAPAVALDSSGSDAPAVADVQLPLGDAAGPGAQAATETPADMVGVKWDGDPDAEFQVEVRREGSDTWEPAATLGATDVGADEGSPDARSAARARDGALVSDPVAVEDTSAVRVTVVSGTVSDVSVATVVSAERSAPSGSAGAWGGSIPGTPDRFGYAIALVILGLVLGLIALGWSPWRSRRTLTVLGVTALLVLTACVPPPPPPPPAPPPEPSSPSDALAPQPAIIPRAQWGAQAFSASPDCQPGPEIASSVKFAVVHHADTPNTDSSDFGRTRVLNIQAYHMGTLGYCDIAYNFLIDRYGQIYEGRAGGIARAVVAAHAGGFNNGSTGVALLGTFTSEQPTGAQWDSLVSLLAWKLSVHHVNPSLGFTTTAGSFSGSRFPAGASVSMPNAIIGHQDVDFTECPGAAFYPRLGELRNAVQPRVGWAAPVTTTTSTTSTTTTTTTAAATQLDAAPPPPPPPTTLPATTAPAPTASTSTTSVP